jgi:acetyltransferase-like isoleucine patch superfamily enzyme/2-polyprenyl-3-methyl-5-hydroxy-6-metoxy-1,4-benzoquinol methylase
LKAGRHTYGHDQIDVRSWGEPAELTIGSFCSIADRVTVYLGGNHRTDWVTTYPFAEFPETWESARGIEGHPATNGDVTIGNDVWIGSGSTILSGVTIGDGAAIGANSCVTRDVEPYTIVAGNPARLVRHRFSPPIVEQLLKIRWWEWSDERIAENTSLLCSGDVEGFVRAHGELEEDGGRGDGPREAGGDAPRYDFDEIDLDSGSVHADVVHLVGRDVRVLELGTATGYMSRVLSQRGCDVVGVEFDAEMAERAAAFCERMIVGDLDRLDLEAELGDDRFDAIVAADVIEHLKDPLGLLERLRPFLKEGGHFVISIPNIAHGSVRLALLSGRFEYGDWGLLDSTHLRFFTRESFERLLEEAGLGLVELRRHDLPLDASEVKFEPSAIPAQLPEEVEADPEARTYQFVARAAPMAAEARRLSHHRLRDLEEPRPLPVVGRGEQRIRAENRALRDQNLQLSARLERILSTPPARAYAALRRLPGLRRRRAA